MQKATRCRGQLRNPCAHCSHKDVLYTAAWPAAEPVSQRKGFSCISSNSHKVTQHRDRQQGMGFGSSAAKALHLRLLRVTPACREGKTNGMQPQESWSRSTEQLPAALLGWRWWLMMLALPHRLPTLEQPLLPGYCCCLLVLLLCLQPHRIRMPEENSHSATQPAQCPWSWP